MPSAKTPGGAAHTAPPFLPFPARIVMSRFRTDIQGWLLMLPAAVLLAAFTHYPALATLWFSFFTTPRGNSPARFIGLENYHAMLADTVFWPERQRTRLTYRHK